MLTFLTGNKNKVVEAKAILPVNFKHINLDLDEIHGKNGFAFDFVFVPEGHNKTYAEMTAEEKNKISMRKIALEKFAKYLDKKL